MILHVLKSSWLNRTANEEMEKILQVPHVRDASNTSFTWYDSSRAKKQMAEPYRVCATLLVNEEVEKILQDSHVRDVAKKLPPVKPKGGEIYLIQAADDSQKVCYNYITYQMPLIIIA